MKYFLIAGEASGDLHASALMRALRKEDPAAEFRYMGGEGMEAVSPGMVMHYKETSYMMLDVLFHLRKIFRNLALVKKQIAEWKPDVVIPVDYPGFNMRILRFAARKGFRVYYYISPKVWAWKQRRVKDLRRHASRVFVIFPFEVEWFAGKGMEVSYLGNPLMDGRSEFIRNFSSEQWKREQGLDQRPLVALLPGSRRSEIKGLLPVMLDIARAHPESQFVVAGAPSMPVEFYAPLLNSSGVKLIHDSTYALLASAQTALVTSGTATLETALFKVPQVVMYRTSSLAYSIAKRLIRVKHISLVNLILDRPLVREVIQKKLLDGTREEFERIHGDGTPRQAILSGYEELGTALGESGVSHRIAVEMIKRTGSK